MSAESATRDPRLEALERLVGTWKISGGSEGEATYEWMEGRQFLVQRGRVVRPEGTFTYVQIIGLERTPGEDEPEHVTGRLYTSDGMALRYTSEADDRGMTIWMGDKGSPSVYRGEWSDDGNTLAGAWEWPGGGYDETMTRVG
jgi:hypothetical protein